MNPSRSSGGDRVKVVITGGGTAGHTNPGIAVAQALVGGGLAADQIRFIGSTRGNEGTIVPEAGFQIDLLPGRGIRRSVSMGALKDNAGAILALAKGQVQALRLLRTLRPQVVLCLGGFAAAGASVAAILLRVPIVVTEQNARASAVNRMIGRFARECAIPYLDTDLPRPTLTGNPIRSEVLDAVAAAEPEASRSELGISHGRFVIAVWAGSLGALRINTEVRELAERWRSRDDVSIYHVVGRRDWSQFGDIGDLKGAPIEYRTVEYESRMPLLLSAADMAICRGGASTAAELAVAGLPAVAVPLPNAPRDHQRANLAELAGTGALVILDDEKVTAETLAGLVDEVMSTPGEREKRSLAARSVARPGAADAVADLVLRVANLNRKA